MIVVRSLILLLLLLLSISLLLIAIFPRLATTFKLLQTGLLPKVGCLTLLHLSIHSFSRLALLLFIGIVKIMVSIVNLGGVLREEACVVAVLWVVAIVLLLLGEGLMGPGG